jgi:hypothetical protein
LRVGDTPVGVIASVAAIAQGARTGFSVRKPGFEYSWHYSETPLCEGVSSFGGVQTKARAMIGRVIRSSTQAAFLDGARAKCSSNKGTPDLRDLPHSGESQSVEATVVRKPLCDAPELGFRISIAVLQQ